MHPQTPKTIKGTGCTHALKIFSNSQLVWAETKYDGERTQVHVKVDQKKSVELRVSARVKENRQMTDMPYISGLAHAKGTPVGTDEAKGYLGRIGSPGFRSSPHDEERNASRHERSDT